MLLSCLAVGAVCLVIELTKSGTKKAAEELSILENEATTTNSYLAEEDMDEYDENYPDDMEEEDFGEITKGESDDRKLVANNVGPEEPIGPNMNPKRGRTFLVKSDPIIRLVTIIQVSSIILLFVIFFILLTRKYSGYLNEITGAIEKMSAGDFDVKISRRNESELLTIADGLNQMSEDIKVMIEREHENERAKNELITSVAHDLRTPLTSIIGYLELINKKEDLPIEKKMEYAGIAYDKSKRLESLIEDLFSFTKVSFGEIKIHKTEIDMVKLIQQLEDEFYPQVARAGLEATYTYHINSLKMEVDGELMARAVANIISNAIKYGKDGKKLIVDVDASDQAMVFSITNYGRMIPKEDLEHIFDRFYRVESSRSTDTGGSGLGLAITKNIINMHDGDISVRSDEFGTVFTVSLPVSAGKRGNEKDEKEQKNN